MSESCARPVVRSLSCAACRVRLAVRGLSCAACSAALHPHVAKSALMPEARRDRAERPAQDPEI